MLPGMHMRAYIYSAHHYDAINFRIERHCCPLRQSQPHRLHGSILPQSVKMDRCHHGCMLRHAPAAQSCALEPPHGAGPGTASAGMPHPALPGLCGRLGRLQHTGLSAVLRVLGMVQMTLSEGVL